MNDTALVMFSIVAVGIAALVWERFTKRLRDRPPRRWPDDT